MPAAKWMHAQMTARLEADPEGFGFCSFCGEECPRGVVVRCNETRRGAFIVCRGCVAMMAEAVSLARIGGVLEGEDLFSRRTPGQQ